MERKLFDCLKNSKLIPENVFENNSIINYGSQKSKMFGNVGERHNKYF